MAKKKAAKKTAKKATKKKGAKKGAAKEPLIVASKVKAYVKSKGLMTASDSLDSRDRQLRDFSQRHSTKQQDMMGEIRKRILDNMNARPQSARMRKN